MDFNSNIKSVSDYANNSVTEAGGPLSMRIQDILSTALIARNQANELRGRLFGFSPSVVEGKNAEPTTTEAVVDVTRRTLAEVTDILSEINSRF